MTSRRSEIFDSYVKIALEKDFDKDADDIKSKLEKNPRADSHSISDIEALYGVKPNTPKDMEYKHNIMEDAHPKPMVISPAYDKINGLVENNIERQNIMINIVNKVPNGHLTGHKYAQHDLLLSLVRVANDMDNNDAEELRKLADVCAEQLTNSKKKVIIKDAFAPLAFIGIGLGVKALAGITAGIIGTIWVQQHWPAFSEGFETGYKNLQDQLNDFIKSNTNWGVGAQYKESFLKEISTIQGELSNFYNQYKAIEAYIVKIDKPSGDKELLEYAQTDKGKQDAQAFEQLKQAALSISEKLTDLSSRFKDENYKLRQIQEKGFITKLIDKTQVLHGGKGLFTDDFDDVRDAIVSFEEGVKSLVGIVNGGERVKEKAETKATSMLDKMKSAFTGAKDKASEIVSGASGKASEMVGDKTPDNKPTNKPTKKPFNPSSDLDELQKQLNKAMQVR
jgi:predicted  nucleic acid-binding Zn-ribbon protein